MQRMDSHTLSRNGSAVIGHLGAWDHIVHHPLDTRRAHNHTRRADTARLTGIGVTSLEADAEFLKYLLIGAKGGAFGGAILILLGLYELLQYYKAL